MSEGIICFLHFKSYRSPLSRILATRVNLVTALAKGPIPWNEQAAIESAWKTAHDTLLDITGQTRLLEKHPALDASIRLRLPYIEPLNLLQVELLKRHRAGETDARVREGIQLSINAVATALRNSG